MVAFQELILQPDVLSSAHPDETNPALLRWEQAGGKGVQHRSSATATKGLLNRPGQR